MLQESQRYKGFGRFAKSDTVSSNPQKQLLGKGVD